MKNEIKIISCKIAAELISKSLDRKLSLYEQASLESHLAICGACVSFLKHLNFLNKILPQYPQFIDNITPPAEELLSQESKIRIRKILRDKDFKNAGS